MSTFGFGRSLQDNIWTTAGPRVIHLATLGAVFATLNIDFFADLASLAVRLFSSFASLASLAVKL